MPDPAQDKIVDRQDTKSKHTREVVVALAGKDQLASLDCVREGERCLNYQVLSSARSKGRMPLSKV
jgi:hypothetical protein